jgi:hypothetical protein
MRAIPRTIPVAWLNVQTQPSYPADPESVNRALGAASARWPNLTIVDVNLHFRNHPEWHLGDGLHFDDTGSTQLAKLIEAALPPVRRAVR